MSLRYTRENTEPHFSRNEGFFISSIRAQGEGRGQVPSKPLPFETLHEGSAIRFLGSVYATAQVVAVRHLLPRVLHLLPFIISYDMTKEVGQGSGSSERMRGYDWFIYLLFYVFQIMLVSVVYPCCFKRCYESVLFVQLYHVCFCYKIYAMSACFVGSVKLFHTLLSVYFSSSIMSFHMLSHVYCCYEIYVLPYCYASYILLSCFK
jgi:hypothetical protein